MKLSRGSRASCSTQPVEKLANVFVLVLAILFCGVLFAQLGAAEWKAKPDNTPIPRYFDKRLRAIEDRLIKVEWQYQQSKPKVEECPPPVMEKYFKTLSPEDLAKVAIWSNFALEENPRWHFWLYQSVYYGAIWELGQRKGPAVERALTEIAYQSAIDTHPAEALREAWGRCTHREFKIHNGVHVDFHDGVLIRPMTEEAALFVMPMRRTLISKRSDTLIPEFERGNCASTFEILPGGRVSKIKSVALDKGYVGKKMTASDSAKIVSGIDKYLKSLQFPAQLPCGLKKVSMSVQFY